MLVGGLLAYEYSCYRFVLEMIIANGSTHLMNTMAGGLLTAMNQVLSSVRAISAQPHLWPSYYINDIDVYQYNIDVNYIMKTTTKNVGWNLFLQNKYHVYKKSQPYEFCNHIFIWEHTFQNEFCRNECFELFQTTTHDTLLCNTTSDLDRYCQFS